MKETTFIEQNKKKWAKFERMSKQSQSDPDELSDLFVELTDDLAYARTHYPKRSVRVYLNSLAQKSFHGIYKKKRESIRKFISFWTTSLPLELYRSRKALFASFIVFTVGMLIGIISTADDPDFLGAVIGYEYVDMTEYNIEQGRPMDVYGGDNEAGSFIMIAQNNLRVSMMAFVLGLFFSIGSAFFMFFNGIMVGAFQWFFKVRGLLLTSFLTIWIHGAFEISAIVIAGGAGMTMGNGLMFPGTLTRAQSLSISAKRGIKIMIGLFPVIVIAAFLEGYATRHTEWPDALKWFIILTSFAIMILYFVIYPIVVARKYNFTGKFEEKPIYIPKKELILYKIRDVGEVFTDTFTVFRTYFNRFFLGLLLIIPVNIAYVFFLFQHIPVHHYQYKVTDMAWTWMHLIYLRSEKMVKNLEVMYTWNDYFEWSLFFVQVLMFAFNATVFLYFIRLIKEKRTPVKRVKELGRFMLLNLWKMILAFTVIGLMVCFSPFPLMLLELFVTPFLFMFMLPTVLEKGNFFKNLGRGFSKAAKGWGTGLGIFCLFLFILFLFYNYGSLPIDLVKDDILEWFILPTVDNFQYVLNYIDAVVYLTFSQMIFPLFIIAFSLIYYSTVEKEEAYGMFEKLKTFGTKSKVYESQNDGEY